MYALPESCPFTGLFIPNPIYSTKPTNAIKFYLAPIFDLRILCR
ncbi:hypothetical protein [Serratia symbiotica]